MVRKPPSAEEQLNMNRESMDKAADVNVAVVSE